MPILTDTSVAIAGIDRVTETTVAAMRQAA
jgi:hypothetical protein